MQIFAEPVVISLVWSKSARTILFSSFRAITFEPMEISTSNNVNSTRQIILQNMSIDPRQSLVVKIGFKMAKNRLFATFLTVKHICVRHCVTSRRCRSCGTDIWRLYELPQFSDRLSGSGVYSEHTYSNVCTQIYTSIYRTRMICTLIIMRNKTFFIALYIFLSTIGHHQC